MLLATAGRSQALEMKTVKICSTFNLSAKCYFKQTYDFTGHLYLYLSLPPGGSLASVLRIENCPLLIANRVNDLVRTVLRTVHSAGLCVGPFHLLPLGQQKTVKTTLKKSVHLVQ